MRTLLGLLLPVLLGALHGATPSYAQDADKAAAEKQDEQEEQEEITLERLFPEKRFFGASARSSSFSHDGRYAAYLWKTWPERRHGYDLWLHDFQTGETRRLTSATTFEPFQRDAKEVADDRREQAKKAAAKKAKASQADEDEKGEEKDDGKKGPGEEDEEVERDLGDVVDEDDADREDAPRWRGVSSYAWSPVADEMLIVCGGDVYRWKVEDEGLERVTHTRDGEGGVQWLDDGSGFLYRQGGALLRVVFGDHRIVQLDPELPSGESLGSFALSPDGKKLALLAVKGDRSFTGGGRTVKIADYGDRFMSVREVPRLVSDDPQPDRESILYVYVLPEGMGEDGELHRLHRHAHTGPRDQVRTPDWAPDSSRVAFAVFTQADSEVEVFEAILPVDEEPGGSWAELVARAKGPGEGGEKKEDDEKDDDEEGDEAEEEEPESKEADSDVHELPARVVYKFLHQGGPNTPAMVDPHYTADSRHLVFVTEQSGFRHLGRLDPLYERFEPLTSGPFEVYLEFLPDARDYALVSSTQEDPACQDVYRVDLETGGMTRLTRSAARYSSVGAAPDGGRLLAVRSAYGQLRELVAIDVAAESETALTDSHAPEAKELTAAVPEFFDFESRHGFALHGMMFKPEGWKPEDRRPALIYVYGGPLGTRKEVVQGSYSGSAYLFAWYMAKEHGYVTATIDTRGMSGYGAVFEKANFEQVGKPQVEDLVDGARWLVENAGVDPERIGLHGWSFGGFQTQMCMYTEPEVFACGIAGAGPTEWENYNSWYSTGTIGESRQGSPDLEKYSLLPLAKNLERKLLLVHGMEDSNVLYQDTVRVYAELLKAGKETLVELFLDPSGGHGLGGEVKSLGRYRKYEEFLLRCLGSADG